MKFDARVRKVVVFGGLALTLVAVYALCDIAAWGGFQAIVNGQYADGVARPYEFILTDQLPIMLFALIHTLAVLELPWDRT